MNNPQQTIQALLDRLCAEGLERGIQVAAYHDGKMIVNAWSGIADAITGARVDPDTLFPVFSVTKGLAATIVHQLVERGLLNYDMRIAEVWPEFGCNGKAGMTLEQILRHTAGVTKLPAGTTIMELSDWGAICGIIAGLPAEWEPGTRYAYHGLTCGWILGEVVRRVDGRNFSQLVQEEICTPLGIDTIYVGLPANCTKQVAWLEYPEAEILPDDGTPQVVPFSMQPLYAWMNRSEGRQACVPAGNGIMNAGALARHYAALLPGGIDGVELLSPTRVDRAATFGEPPVGDEIRPKGWGLGYLLGEPGEFMGDTPAAFGVGGHGGAIGFADRSRKLAVGMARNLFSPDEELIPELQRILSELRIVT